MISLERLLGGYAQRLCPSLTQDPRWFAGAPRVVIVGAGFGGIATAQAMRHAWARITLIDRRNYHLFQPLLYQVATATLSPADIAVPIRALVRGQQNCQVLMGRVTDVDRQQNEVAIGDRRVPFDYPQPDRCDVRLVLVVPDLQPQHAADHRSRRQRRLKVPSRFDRCRVSGEIHAIVFSPFDAALDRCMHKLHHAVAST